MERDAVDETCTAGTSGGIEGSGAVNSLILDYYKKFGRKRDLEQFFSVSTAQSDIKDTSGLFWRKMKSENDSSDSGGRKSDSSHEVCRISIRCSLPDATSSQDDDDHKTKTDSPQTESPPIIIEEMPADVTRHTDDESINFDDNNSQKSLDTMLDLSTQKPLSPTSSITSQRRLEWDSLADVGYANESDRKNSASSLSTLERLALKQQYSNNDSKQDIGPPTLHSTPLDESEAKSKVKKGIGKKTTKVYKKDVDFVEVNVPHNSETNQAPSINVNLTKHISFNVERDGGVTVENIKKDVNVSPEKVSVEIQPYVSMDQEIQTTLVKEKPVKDQSTSVDEPPKPVNPYNQKIPVMISLNTLRKRLRRKKSRNVKRKLRTKKQVEVHKEETPQEKSGEQLSEAESFEYMPGHMYHQNQMKNKENKPDHSTVGNKSSLESSGPLTSDSSKGSKHSLTQDLEKCVEALKVTLQKRYDDSNAKKRLIKEIVQRLISSKYRDDDTTTEFLSGLSFNSEKLGFKGQGNTTTSTSDANNTADSSNKKPKKSILRNEKFNANAVASTSQSAPNLFSVSTEKVNSNLIKAITSNTESDVSSKEKTSSENAFPKTSSEELYLKYLEALRREEAYKRHLRDKELFLKQKLVSSETAFKVPLRPEPKMNNKLKDLMKDLTRNNYDDGSGDASKLEGGSSSNIDIERINPRGTQRSHSVFTLSSSHSDCQKRPNLKKKMQAEREIGEAGTSREHYCCCPHHYANKVDYADSSVQVNIHQCEEGVAYEKPSPMKPKGVIDTCKGKKCKPESPRNTRVVADNVTGDIKYVCLANGKQVCSSDIGDNFMIYKCSKLTNRGVQPDDPAKLYSTGVQCGGCGTDKDDKIELIQPPCQMSGTESSISDNTSKARRHSKSSQTNMVINMRFGSKGYLPSSTSEVKNLCGTSTKNIVCASPRKGLVLNEATRCLQTEISINPQISNPTLSDINIISNCDCAKLISEKRKKVLIHDTDSEGSKTYSDRGTSSTSSEKLFIRSEGDFYKREIKSKDDENKEGEKEPALANAKEKDYTIPIQGTNMTLKVNLAENTLKRDLISKCILTEKVSYADEATSANDECKSTQCSYTFFSPLTHKTHTAEPETGTRKSCLSKKNITNYNTYPKPEPVKEKPPLKRCNTDTDKLYICSCIQTDFIRTKDAETNENQIINDEPEPETCENSCQVYNNEVVARVEIEEKIKETKTDSLKSNTCVYKDCVNVGTQKNLPSEVVKTVIQRCVNVETSDISTKSVAIETEQTAELKGSCIACQTEVPPVEKDQETRYEIPSTITIIPEATKQETTCYRVCCQKATTKGPVIEMIQDITRRYSKTDMMKIKKKKCFSEIMTVLNYLLETEDSTDPEPKICCSTSTETKSSSNKSKHKSSEPCSDKVDKSVQLSCKKSKDKLSTQSSDLPCSTDPPVTSSDSTACKVLNKIKKECEKYHQKIKCKGRKCEVSSSTSVNCEKCKKTHHCACRSHRCKRSRAFEKLQKKCIAYNLIIQTSESMLSEETVCQPKGRPLKNIIVKVPKRENGRKGSGHAHGSVRSSPLGSPRCGKNRSQSCPNESETSDEYARRIELATVREYLEQNRPDFVEKTSQRQNSLKYISERRPQDPYSPSVKMIVVHTPKCNMANVANAPVYCRGMCYKTNDYLEPCIACDSETFCPCGQNTCDTCKKYFDSRNLPPVPKKLASERASKRDLLSLHVERQPDLTSLSSDELRDLAKQIGLDLRKKKPAPKFISEREMKKHSEKIYKTLPEVVQKKEEKRKENIKKTNLLMANIFKKNLQKQTLRGSVNLSNYSPVIKI